MLNVALMVHSLHFGGVERVVAELSLWLESRGMNVHVFTLDASAPDYPYGGRLHSLSYWYKKASRLTPLLAWQHVLLARKLKKKYKIDVTISALEFENLLNVMSPRGALIASLHNYKLQHEVTTTAKDRLIEKMFTARSARLSALVCVAGALKDKVRPLYKLPDDKIVRIYNATDVDKIAAASRQPLPPELARFVNDRTFVCACRLVHQKGLDNLLAAFKKVFDSQPDARLVIMGDGQLRGSLERGIASLGLGGSVILTGFCKNPFSLMAAARAFVLPSRYEGFGNVIVEALAAGACVVSTDCDCGPREILAPNTTGKTPGVERAEYGLLTRPGDDDGAVGCLAEAMLTLLRDDALCALYRSKAVSRARDFSPEVIYPQWERLIYQAAGRAGEE